MAYKVKVVIIYVCITLFHVVWQIIGYVVATKVALTTDRGGLNAISALMSINTVICFFKMMLTLSAG